MAMLFLILFSLAARADTTQDCEKRLLEEFAVLSKGRTDTAPQTADACFAAVIEIQKPYANYPLECEKIQFSERSAAAQKVVPAFKDTLELQKWKSPKTFTFDELLKMLHSALFAPLYTKCLNQLESERLKKP